MNLNSALEILTRLVAFETLSERSNLPVLEYVGGLLQTSGVEYQLVAAPADKAAESDKGKANLWAVIGPQETPGIALSGHTDVVPTVGQNWSRDPFRLHVAEGRAYGRGTCDMKGFLACVLAMLPEFCAQDLRQPIVLYFSYDEEVGCRGVKHLIDALGSTLPAPKLVIVGEPSMMRTISAHKSLMLCKTEVTGSAGHSSAPHKGASAVMTAAKIITEIDALAVRLRADTPADDAAQKFDPPHTSLHVGMMSGGTAANIIANHAEFCWDIRSLPQELPQNYLEQITNWAETHLLPDMRHVAPESAIATEILCDLPAFAHHENSPAETLVRRLSGDNSLNFASYMAEAGLFQRAGLPVVIYGPGSIAQAHQPDEWVALDQLEQCLRFLHDLTEHLRR